MGEKQDEEVEAKVGPAATLLRWYSDGRVSLSMRTFSDAQHQSETLQNISNMNTTKSTVTQSRYMLGAIYKGLRGVIRPQR